MYIGILDSRGEALEGAEIFLCCGVGERCFNVEISDCVLPESWDSI